MDESGPYGDACVPNWLHKQHTSCSQGRLTGPALEQGGPLWGRQPFGPYFSIAYSLLVVVPIIPIFMIDLNRISTNKKNLTGRKIDQRRSIYSLIEDRSSIYAWQLNPSFFIAKKNWKIDHRKIKRSIT